MSNKELEASQEAARSEGGSVKSADSVFDFTRDTGGADRENPFVITSPKAQLYVLYVVTSTIDLYGGRFALFLWRLETGRGGLLSGDKFDPKDLRPGDVTTWLVPSVIKAITPLQQASIRVISNQQFFIDELNKSAAQRRKTHYRGANGKPMKKAIEFRDLDRSADERGISFSASRPETPSEGEKFDELRNRLRIFSEKIGTNPEDDY
jgi:hypothetical protein